MSAPFGFKDNATFLAPMQDITDRGFMNIVAGFGAPDCAIAEYFRIHEYYELEPRILDSVLNPPAGVKVAAQFIGESETYISQAIEDIKKYPQITMLDLNIGCPAPKIYKKNVGGGLLRDPAKIGTLTKLIRERWSGCFSVKMRIGFDSSDRFEELLDAVSEGSPDFVTVHARTVKQLYRGVPEYDVISRAVRHADFPIIANGDVSSAEKAVEIFARTGCAGVMCGRHAVRNPWIFRQIKEALAGREIFRPTLSDVRGYIDKLYQNTYSQKENMRYVDSRLKKFINFIAIGVDARGEFLYQMRRARGIDELFKICDAHLIENGNGEKPFGFDAYPDLCARPNHEDKPL